MALAFFDLDGTITKTDSYLLYCAVALIHRPWRLLTLKRVVKACFMFQKGEIARQELKEAFTGAFLGGATKRQVTKWNKTFFRFVLPLIIRNRILNRAREHQRRGDRVYIVSASPDVYLAPLVRRWRLDGLICTNLECEGHRLTGRIRGRNCRGEEKVRRIRRLFDEGALKGSYGYGNSDGDRQMLELVSVPYYL